MNINEMAKEAYATAVEKGWYGKDDGRPPLALHMLMVSEIAEATECVRKAQPSEYVGEGNKPEGEATELADCVIRIMDYFQWRGWDLERVIRCKMEFNKTRSYRHGGKTA